MRFSDRQSYNENLILVYYFIILGKAPKYTLKSQVYVGYCRSLSGYFVRTWI